MTARDVCFSLSAAGLCFLSVYALLRSIARLPHNYYFVRHLPAASDHIALIANIVILAAAILGLRIWRLRGGAVARRTWFVAMTAVGAIASIGILRAAGLLNTRMASELAALLRSAGPAAWVVGPLVAAAAGWAVLEWKERLAKAAGVLVVALVPIPVLIVADSARSAVAATRQILPADQEPLPRPVRGAARRPVLLIVFDEADYRLIFESDRVSLPEIQRLRREAFTATAAHPPSNMTELSIPALTTGLMVREAKPVGGREVVLRLTDGRAVLWTRVRNIFRSALDHGLTVGIVGWAHPYGRLFRTHAARWYEIPSQANSMGTTVAGKVVNQWRTLFETPRLSPFGQSLVTRQAVAIHLALTRDALRLVADPGIDFQYLHFSIPHSPHIFDAETGTYTRGNDRFAGYFGNLVLMDRTLGAIRQAAERSGVWDSGVVVVTSDHWCRYASKIDGRRDHRVPFLVKMPGQRRGVEYRRPFNTVVLRDLVEAILRRDIVAAEEIPGWLATNAAPLAPVEQPGFD